jgi:two-component system response regulator HydG
LRKPTVLVIDDGKAMVETLSTYLGEHGFRVQAATSGEAALKQFDGGGCDVVLTDLRMPGFDGMDVLEEIRKRDPQVPVVIMTAFGNVASAVEAMQRGAYHYVTKPFSMADVRALLQRAVRDRLMREENAHLRAAIEERFASRGLIGQSAVMRELRESIGRVANAPSPVLILGEIGTGKEAVARALHLESDRRDGPFVVVNGAALSTSMLDSELFGHVAGAFPGATHARRGLLGEADGGTVFLDEVGDMPPAVQAKLVRVLQHGEFRPVGGEVPRRVNVRFIAATRQDLFSLVHDGKFREDLYYRLDVVPLRIPALRERQEDIALLANYFLAQNAEQSGRTLPTISADALRLLESHSWPGNVRELKNLIERLMVMTSGMTIDADAIRPELTPIYPGDPIQSLVNAHLPLDTLEDRYIAGVLRHTGGNKPKAAAILRIDISTLYRRERQRS